MRSEQDHDFMRQPYARTHAAARLQQRNHYKIVMFVAYALASAIVVLWMANMPTLVGSVMTKLNIVPTHLSSESDSITRTNKGDRFASVRFNDRWNAFAAMTIQTLGENGVDARVTDTAKNIPQILVGCEPAFSQLVRAGNFSSRCVASANIPTPLA